MKRAIIKYILGIFLAGVMAVAVGGAFYYFHALHYTNDEERQNDLAVLTEDSYDLLLLTMYSKETVKTYPFEYYMAYNTYKPEHCFENLADISDYIETALTLNESVFEVYTFFDPGIVSAAYFNSDTLVQRAYQKSLLASINANPDVRFVFLLPSYSLEYWKELSDQKIAASMDAYKLFCGQFGTLENVDIYYFGHLDWMIANQGNFVEPTACTEELNQRMIALSIWNDAFLLTDDEIVACTEKLEKRIAREKAAEPAVDLSACEVVFMGDSIIGNYSGSLSIPGALNALVGADTYNCAIGGQAATVAMPEAEVKAFDEAVDYFLTGKPEDAFLQKEQFRAETARFWETSHDASKLIFVISFGLNDYFAGLTVGSPATYDDIYTYSGALYTGVKRLMEAYPDANVVLMTPTFSKDFEYGTAAQSEVGGTLVQYADAVLAIAEDLKISVMDNYRDLGIDESNVALYLEDGCHYNESGRYLIAEKLAELLTKLYTE